VIGKKKAISKTDVSDVSFEMSKPAELKAQAGFIDRFLTNLADVDEFSEEDLNPINLVKGMDKIRPQKGSMFSDFIKLQQSFMTQYKDKKAMRKNQGFVVSSKIKTGMISKARYYQNSGFDLPIYLYLVTTLSPKNISLLEKNLASGGHNPADLTFDQQASLIYPGIVTTTSSAFKEITRALSEGGIPDDFIDTIISSILPF